MSDWNYIFNHPQQGWVCPVCGGVNAPWMPSCPCGGNEKKTITTVTGTTIEPNVDIGTTTHSVASRKCPKCGGNMTMICQTTIPPICVVRCNVCGFQESAV